MSWRLRIVFHCLLLIPLIAADEHNHIVGLFHIVTVKHERGRGY